MKKSTLILIALLLTFGLSAQEYLMGIETKLNQESRKGVFDTINLPFYDNFSQKSIYPNSDLWIDNEAFINNTYPVAQLNYGVATLDILDSIGNVYTNAGVGQFMADRLTSSPINLQNIDDAGTNRPLTIADSVYFSFYYQPQGNGDIPARDDSLILQFKYKDIENNDYWERVWAVPGDTLSVFYAENGTYFKQILIPIVDEKYFYKDFQFRFINYGSLASIPSWQSNTDQWNIDNVYLNWNRNMDDTYYQEIDFVSNPPNFLTPYTSMPPKHFKNDNQIEDFNIYLGNTDSLPHQIKYKVSITKLGTEVFTDSVENNLLSLSHETIFSNIEFDESLQTFLGPNPSTDIPFQITEQLDCQDIDFTKTRNSSIGFHNFFAYDDGSAESGYGVTGSNSKFAYKIVLSKVDTLVGMSIYFNKTFTNANNQYFKIKVWEILNNTPGSQIYESNSFYIEDTLNAEFVTFLFDDGGIELSPNPHLIGIEQSQNEIINIGYDKNTDNHSFLFWNADGIWNQSSYHGSVMMHPLFGGNVTKISESVNKENTNLHLFPVPYISGNLHIQLPNIGNNNFKLHIYNYMGQEIYKQDYSEQVNLSFLNKGVYILEVRNPKSSLRYKSKLIKQ